MNENSTSGTPRAEAVRAVAKQRRRSEATTVGLTRSLMRDAVRRQQRLESRRVPTTPMN